MIIIDHQVGRIRNRQHKGRGWENEKIIVDITVESIKNSIAVDKWDYIIPEGDKAESPHHSFHLQKAATKFNLFHILNINLPIDNCDIIIVGIDAGGGNFLHKFRNSMKKSLT